VLAYLVRRLFYAVGTLILTAFFAYGVMRALRPEQYPGQATVADLFSDVDRALLHLDFGRACMFAGCPSIKGLWLDGIVVDLMLLAGGVAFGVAFGVLGGLWCASRRRTRSARALEGVTTLLYCAPVYVIGLGILLLFAPPFGLFELPYFFDPDSYAPPLENPWDFLRSMLLPWIVVGAPLGAAILRLTLALSAETLGEDYVRTIFAVPGFFRHMRRALGQVPNWPPPKVPPLDILTLQALALWAAVLIVTVGLLADLAIMRLDPRIRAGGRTVG